MPGLNSFWRIGQLNWQIFRSWCNRWMGLLANFDSRNWISKFQGRDNNKKKETPRQMADELLRVEKKNENHDG